MRKAKVFSVIALALLCSCLPAAAAAETEAATVRVLLSVGKAQELVIDISGGYEADGVRLSDGLLTVCAENGRLSLTHSVSGYIKTDVSFYLSSPSGEGFLTLYNTRYGDCRYKGGMLVSLDDAGDIRVVNHVCMREYLVGVVGGELKDSYPIEALKAQAIAAKGYALARMGDGGAEYDMDDSPNDQVYKGYAPVWTNVTAAVDAVWRETLTYGGKPFKCFYCTSNGGQTLTPYQRWGGSSYRGIYEMRYDPYDLMHNESAAMLSVTDDPAYLDGRLYDFFLSLAKQQTSAVKILSIDALRGIYDMEDLAGTERYPHERAPQEGGYVTMTVRTGSGKKQVTCAFLFEALLETGAMPESAADTRFIEQTGAKEWLIVCAEASGHRVGMSHKGILAMGELGFDYEAIIAFYYPGAELSRPQETAAPEAADAADAPVPAATAVCTADQSAGEEAGFCDRLRAFFSEIFD